MKSQRATFIAAILAAFCYAVIMVGRASDIPVASTPVYKPDYSHEHDPLPDGVLTWNSVMMSTNLPADTAQAHFLFAFTNVAMQVNRTLKTNLTSRMASPRYNSNHPLTKSANATNVVWVTNSVTPLPVTVLDVHPSCGCTTAQLPNLPWIISPGGTGQIPVTVNVEGKTGTFFKSIQFSTDKGTKQLLLEITMDQPAPVTMTEADRAHGIAVAKIDRQAVFHND